MNRWSRAIVAAAVPAVIAMAACRTTTPPPAPERLRPASGTTADSARPSHQAADARFVRQMMAHHAQALVMTQLVSSRSVRDDVRLLAERIAVSQRDEIERMGHWLERHGEAVPSFAASHEHHGAPAEEGQAAGSHQAAMPGMLTGEELARLERATGADFDRLFLQYMIRHHEGALTMVAELFGSRGAGQDPELFQLASDIDADQRAEIARMRRLQNGPAPAAPRR
ncbi:MAG TPA: DUF305 domain-containing protein [Gemmatimonadaceae bacterium]|nr:DUF305 domain-containing protein [Gemmatimonadaceae bacterium]